MMEKPSAKSALKKPHVAVEHSAQGCVSCPSDQRHFVHRSFTLLTSDCTQKNVREAEGGMEWGGGVQGEGEV